MSERDAEPTASDESVQVIHLRLCRRAVELKSPIAALEEAAEEIAELQGALEAARNATSDRVMK